MIQVNTREARQRLAELLSAAQAGETVEIVRHGKTVARLVPPLKEKAAPLPDLDELHRRLKVRGKPLSRVVVEERLNSRY